MAVISLYTEQLVRPIAYREIARVRTLKALSHHLHLMSSEDVARIATKPAPRPIFVKDASGEHLYTHTGNQSDPPAHDARSH
ncbi:MAG: hypothetical protein WKF84_01330 [Pyrinomonadaceae bacterium]